MNVPRDRAGTFEPQLVKKHQTTIGDEIESKILALYAQGMSYADISSHLVDMYGVGISPGTITNVTDKIVGKVKEWQGRPLESVYPVVWMDAIHYKIREGGRVVLKAVYTVLAIFKYPEHIRKIIYTTNAIEAVHRQFRKLTKTKGAFPNQDSLIKLLYVGIQNASKKWTMPIRHWQIALSQMAIFFEGRLDDYL